jgi:hypothetical protein
LENDIDLRRLYRKPDDFPDKYILFKFFRRTVYYDALFTEFFSFCMANYNSIFTFF